MTDPSPINVDPTVEAHGVPPELAENGRAVRPPGRPGADKRLLGVWEIPTGLDAMTDEEIDELAGKIADSMAIALECREQPKPDD